MPNEARGTMRAEGAGRAVEVDFATLISRAVVAAGGVRPLARQIGCSAAHVCDMAHGRRGPGSRILAHFGLRRVVQPAVVHYEVIPQRALAARGAGE